MEIDFTKEELEDLCLEKRRTKEAIESGYTCAEGWEKDKEWQKAHKLHEKLELAISYYR